MLKQNQVLDAKAKAAGRPFTRQQSLPRHRPPRLRRPITGNAAYCVWAANGHVIAAAPSPTMNSRRRITCLRNLTRQQIIE